MEAGLNVLGEPLEPCSFDPLTGFHRDGRCRTGGADSGVHAVCAVMTEEFLAFSRCAGNDLSTPRPAGGFPVSCPATAGASAPRVGRRPSAAGVAPPIVLEATHVAALEFASRDDLLAHALEA